MHVQPSTYSLSVSSCSLLIPWVPALASPSFLSCSVCVYICLPFAECLPPSVAHFFPDCPSRSLSCSVFSVTHFSLPRSHAQLLSLLRVCPLTFCSLFLTLAPRTLAAAHALPCPWLCENPLSSGPGPVTQLGVFYTICWRSPRVTVFPPGGDLAVVCSVSSLLQFPDSTEARSPDRHSDSAAAATLLIQVRGVGSQLQLGMGEACEHVLRRLRPCP